MRSIFLVSAILIACFSTSQANIFGFWFGTSCPTTDLISDFNQDAYFGKWYEIERIPMIFERNLDCVTAEYGRNDNGRISVKNSGTNLKTNQTSVTIGEAYVPNLAEPNKLIVQFGNNIIGIKFSNDGNYHVWKTDYNRYALVYSCKVYLGFIKFEASWILSRTKEIDPNLLSEIKAYLTSKKVSVSNFESVKQTCSN